jgi:hypothetical protein
VFILAIVLLIALALPDFDATPVDATFLLSTPSSSWSWTRLPLSASVESERISLFFMEAPKIYPSFTLNIWGFGFLFLLLQVLKCLAPRSVLFGAFFCTGRGGTGRIGILAMGRMRTTNRNKPQRI